MASLGFLLGALSFVSNSNRNQYFAVVDFGELSLQVSLFMIKDDTLYALAHSYSTEISGRGIDSALATRIASRMPGRPSSSSWSFREKKSEPKLTPDALKIVRELKERIGSLPSAQTRSAVTIVEGAPATRVQCTQEDIDAVFSTLRMEQVVNICVREAIAQASITEAILKSPGGPPVMPRNPSFSLSSVQVTGGSSVIPQFQRYLLDAFQASFFLSFLILFRCIETLNHILSFYSIPPTPCSLLPAYSSLNR